MFSEEANAEAAKKVNDPLQVFDTKGTNKRFISYESTQTLFSMSIPPTNDSKTIPSHKKMEILSMTEDQFTVKYILKDLGLGEFANKEREMEFNDIIELEAGDYTGIDSKTETTVGILLINQVLFSPLSIDYPYQNKTFDKGTMEYQLNYIGSKVLSKKLDIKEYKALLKRFEDFSLRFSSYVSPSIYTDMLELDKSVVELRDKLIEENREAIENGDTEKIGEIEEELLKKVKEIYSNHPGMDLFTSGGKPYLDNSYKKSSVMVGAVPADLNSSKFHISTNNFIDGIDKSDIHKISGSMILGAYFRGLNKAV